MLYLIDRKTEGVADLTTSHLGANALGSSGTVQCLLKDQDELSGYRI